MAEMDDSMKHIPLKKKIIFGATPVHERTKFKPPPPPPPKDFYPRPTKYWQLHGTVAYKYRNRYALLFTLMACAGGYYIMRNYDHKRINFKTTLGGKSHYTLEDLEEIYEARRMHIQVESHNLRPNKMDKPATYYRDLYEKEAGVKGTRDYKNRNPGDFGSGRQQAQLAP